MSETLNLMQETPSPVYPQLHADTKPAPGPVIYYQATPMFESPPPPIIVSEEPPKKKTIGQKLGSVWRNFTAPGWKPTANPIQPGVVVTQAPSAPPEAYGDTHAAPESRSFAFFQEIRSKAPVDRLQRAGITVPVLQAAGIDLTTFYDADYSLPQLRQLFPAYAELKALGLSKHFLGAKWNVKALAGLYQIELLALLNDLQLSPLDMCKNGLSVTEIAGLGLSASQLIQAGANFEFWLQLKATPEQFTTLLRGSVADVVTMNLNLEQKKALGLVCDWTPMNMLKVSGFGADSVVRLWYGFKVT